MKTVFNNSQLCHVWANESQSHGNNPKSSLYFRDIEIYSYGSHFLAGKIFNTKIGKIALVNNHNYSNATAKHLNDIRRSLIGKMTFFCVPCPSELKNQSNIDYFNQSVFDCLDRILSSRKYSNFWHIENLEKTVENANEFFSLVGEKPLILTPDFLALLNEINEERAAFLKQKEALNNTPEMIAKKEALKTKKLEKLGFFIKEIQTRAISDFRNGTNTVSYQEKDIVRKNHYLLFGNYALLKIKGENVYTSSGADVPLDHALRLLKLILSNEQKAGERVGHFILDTVLDDPAGDKTIKIGCHLILLSEAVNVLGHLI